MRIRQKKQKARTGDESLLSGKVEKGLYTNLNIQKFTKA